MVLLRITRMVPPALSSALLDHLVGTLYAELAYCTPVYGIHLYVLYSIIDSEEKLFCVALHRTCVLATYATGS